MQLVDRIVAPWRHSGGGLRAGFARLGPPVVSVVMIVLIAAQLASLAWRLLEAPAPPPAPADAARMAGPAVDLTAIVNAHVFGVAAQSGDPAAAPATSANLTLAGTLAGPEPSQGWAIIGASAQAARVYATGSSLPGGARLAEVYHDRVILDRGGARESLMLPRLSGGAAAGRSAYVPSPAAAQPNLAGSIGEMLARNQAAANELLRPQPVFAGGNLRGYRVYPGRNRAQFVNLGLQPGDLVTAVNGAALDDPNRGLEILRGVGQGGAVTLTVERNGQTQQLTVDPTAVAQQLEALPELPQPPTGEATE